MKKHCLSLLCILCCLLGNVEIMSAQSKLGPTYYENDFTGQSVSDEGTNSITGSGSTIFTMEDGALKLTLGEIKTYEQFAVIDLSNSIDLSDNANITLKIKSENLQCDPTVEGFAPSIVLFLYDEYGTRTGGNNSTWEISVSTVDNEWVSGTVDLSKYTTGVNMERIKKIELGYYGTQTITQGTLYFDYIYLGNVPVELPIQNETTFRTEYYGVMVSDAIQSTHAEKGGAYMQDGKLHIPVSASYNAWNTYYTLSLKNTIDLSRDKTMKLSLEVINGEQAAGERPLNQEFSPRLIDVNGKRCVLNGSVLDGITQGVYTLDFTNGYLEDGDFDFTRVKEFRLMTGGTNPGSGELIFDWLQIGMDVVRTDLTLLSVDNSQVSIRTTPEIAELSAAEIKVETLSGVAVELAAVNVLADGEYQISADFSEATIYFLDIVKDGIYINQKLSFNQNGNVVVVTPAIKQTDVGLIRVLFDKQVELVASEISLLDTQTNTPIAISKLTSIYSGLGYDIECALEVGVSAELSFTKAGYEFGAPLFVRIAKNPVILNVDWNTAGVPLTAMHWGVNNYAAAFQDTYDKFHVDFLNMIRPGLVRIHRAGLVENWTDASTRDWDKEKIKNIMTNVTPGHLNSKVLLCMDEWPSWLQDGGVLATDKEQELINLFVKLPGIMKELGFQIDYYEILNERDNTYQNAGKIDALWDLIYRIAVAMKQQYPDIKVGGPALTWPNSAWYKPFVDKCNGTIDFISWHNYASGDPSTTNEELFSGILEQIGTSYPSGVISYLKSKGLDGKIETFLDEYNVQWTWTPYEPRHHNHVGAAWMALLIKRLAIQGMSGATVWNSKDGSYGLLPGDYYSAPAQMFMWGAKYLRGNMKTVSGDETVMELIPVESESGVKSLLVVNKSDEVATLLDLYAIMGMSDGNNLKGLVLDASTQISEKEYTTKMLAEVPNDLVVEPYGSVLITTAEAAPVTPPQNVQAKYVLHDEILLAWEHADVNRRGFDVKVNDETYAQVSDTFCIIKGLNPNTAYQITVSTMDEFSNTPENGQTRFNVTTLAVPLIINDRTIGQGLHQFNYDANWSANISQNAYNGDFTQTQKADATAQLTFEGKRVVIYGYANTSSGNMGIWIDDQKVSEIATNKYDAFSLMYYGNALEDKEHVLKVVAQDDKIIGIDKILIFGSRFENVTNPPAKVTDVEILPTDRTISLSWAAPESESGIQKYVVQLSDGRQDTTVYSPAITIDNVEPEQTYNIVIMAYDPCGNYSVSDPFTVTTPAKTIVNIYQKYPTTCSMTIDGEALEDAWGNSPEYLLENYVGDACMPENLSASFRMLWDKNYLYIFLQVCDDKMPDAVAGSELNENDGFELFLDGGNKKAGVYSRTDVWYQFQLNPQSLKEMYNNNNWLTVAGKKTDNGYNVEMRYKWSGIGMYSIAEDKEFGMELHVNDNDKDGASGLDHKLTWHPNTYSVSQNTTLMANVVLSGVYTALVETEGRIFRCYPNPVKSTLNIDVPADSYKIRLISLSGEKLLETQNAKTISLETLPAGFYILQINAGQTVYQEKLIKE